MQICYLGWGSLIWDPKDLSFRGPWIQGGPTLPIEFCRISADGRLTLVIDGEHGVPVVTRFAASDYSDLQSAREALKEREDCRFDCIGFVDLSVQPADAEDGTCRLVR